MRGSSRGLSGNNPRCTIGKSCGATCIDARERCELELGPLIQPSLRQAVDEITKAQELRGKLKERDLSWSDEKAAKWLNANQKNLEDIHLRFEGGPGTLWTFGIEPGMAAGNIERFAPEIIARLRQDGKIGNEVTYEGLNRVLRENPAVAVRMTRGMVEDSKLMNKAMGQKADIAENLANPKVADKVRKGLHPAMLNPDEEAGKWGSSTYMAKAVLMAQDLGIKKWGAGNMSMISAPDVNIWPYGDVFRRAGMDPGVFKSRDTWMNHMNSANRTGKIADAIISQKPEKVFLGGSYGANIMKSYVKALQEKGIEFETTGKVVNWTSKAGVPRTSKFAVITTPTTRMVFGPHFNAQVPNAVAEMRTALMKGTEKGDPVKMDVVKTSGERKPRGNTKEQVSLKGKPLAERPNGTFTANDVWAAAAAYAPGRVRGWTKEMTKIRNEIRAEYGGGPLKKGEMVDEFRKRAIAAGIVPG